MWKQDAVKFKEIIGREFGLVLKHIVMTQSLLKANITQRERSGTI